MRHRKLKSKGESEKRMRKKNTAMATYVWMLSYWHINFFIQRHRRSFWFWQLQRLLFHAIYLE